ncbi:hypothetical protein NDU88_006022 [Pleurodeles waltl]|uniref:Uncharacterized protein n=1 Tax=Pleurodeles waltl TaxID=8319 RepID=A0AAV7MBP6_PLEWA|nr:hypothetical protein NDU88_006022 [Pleurodeles waltl]
MVKEGRGAPRTPSLYKGGPLRGSRYRRGSPGASVALSWRETPKFVTPGPRGGQPESQGPGRASGEAAPGPGRAGESSGTPASEGEAQPLPRMTLRPGMGLLVPRGRLEKGASPGSTLGACQLRFPNKVILPVPRGHRAERAPRAQRQPTNPAAAVNLAAGKRSSRR